MAGYGFARDIANSELDIQVNGTVALTLTTTNVTLPTGGVLTTNSSLAHGYATGAGGAATQTGNKGATVVVNNVCGTITTDNAALNLATEIAFTVTNSTVAIGDTVVLSQQSGGTSGTYHCFVSDVGAGSFDITIANMTAGSLGEVLLINFAVIKAVSA